MRQQKNHLLLLGCAIGVQLLCATKGYSNHIGYAKANRVNKTSSANIPFAGKTGGKKSLKAVSATEKAFDKISGKVTGPDGKPVLGATVTVQGTKTAVV